MADHQADSTRTVDYKTLFLGACVLVSVLGGSLWGLWDSNHSGEVDEARRSNELQWQRLRELNDKVIENSGSVRYLAERTIDQEDRIRQLEMKSMRR